MKVLSSSEFFLGASQWELFPLAVELSFCLAIFLLAHSTAQSAPSRCGELKSLAAKVNSENELVQEEHRPTAGGDPNWCLHARAITQALTNMIQIIDTDSNRCHVSDDRKSRRCRNRLIAALSFPRDVLESWMMLPT